MKRICMMTMGMALIGTLLAEPQAEKQVLTQAGEFSTLWLPSSSLMVGAVVEANGAARMAAQLPKEESATAYGFAAAGITKEQGSFCLGVLMTDLKVALQANDQVRTTAAIDALVTGLQQLKASEPLLRATLQLGAAHHAGMGTDALRRLGLPMIEPFIEAFVEQEGLVVHLRLGEWVESVRLALASADESKPAAATLLLTQMNPAAFFLSALQNAGLPAGGKAALETLKALANEPKLSNAHITQARTAVEQIALAMR